MLVHYPMPLTLVVLETKTMDEIAQIIMDEEEEIKNSLDKLDLDKEKEMPLEDIPDIDDIPGIDDEDDQVVEEEDPASITMTTCHHSASY